jgi:hypothetical protein
MCGFFLGTLVYATDAPQAWKRPPRNSRHPSLTWEIVCLWA